jgi:hypothetical protein
VKVYLIFVLVLFLSLDCSDGDNSKDSTNPTTQTGITGIWKFVSIVMTDWEAENEFGIQYKDVEFTAQEFTSEKCRLVINSGNFDMLIDFYHPTIQDNQGIHWQADEWGLTGPWALTGNDLTVIDADSNLPNVPLKAILSGNTLTFYSTFNDVTIQSGTAADRFKKTVWERL